MPIKGIRAQSFAEALLEVSGEEPFWIFGLNKITAINVTRALEDRGCAVVDDGCKVTVKRPLPPIV